VDNKTIAPAKAERMFKALLEAVAEAKAAAPAKLTQKEFEALLASTTRLIADMRAEGWTVVFKVTRGDETLVG
jgi:hypothetical protein